MTHLGLKRQRFAAWTLFFILVGSLAPVVPSQAVTRIDSAKDAQWINDTFQEGKKHYEAGDYSSALKIWNTLDPYLDDYPSFKRVISYLKDQIKGGGASRTAKPSTPKPIPAASEKPQIKEVFLKGKLAYATGDWEEAMSQWDKITPYLDSTSQESLLIKKAKLEYQNLKQARIQNQALVAQRTSKLEPPAGFENTLSEATEKMRSEIRDLESKQQSLEKDVVFEEAWVTTTYEKGKDAYLEGRYDDAIAEWYKLIFKLGRQPQLKESIEKMKAAYREYKKARVGYDSIASSADGVKHPASETMQRFFESASDELKQKSETAFRDEKDMKNTYAQQQEQVNQIFLKGKLLYSQGKYKEALDEWQLMSAYFENDPALKSAFLSMQGSSQSYDLAKSSYQAIDSAGAFRIHLPDNFFLTIQDAASKLASQTREVEDKRTETEKAVESKKAEVIQAFDYGKRLYDSGKISEAAAAWRKILPWVENPEDLQTMITQMESNYAMVQREQKALQQTQSKASLSYVAPTDLARLLQSANETLRNQIVETQNERMASDSVFNEKKSRVSATIYKANLAYQSGKIQSAIQEWSRLMPYLDPASEEKVLIQDLQENYAEWLKIRQAQKETVEKGSPKIEFMPDLKKSLFEANDRMIKETVEFKKNQQDLESKLSTQEQQVKNLYEKGRMFYLSGRLKEAVQEWKKIGDFWAEGTDIRVLLDQLESNLEDNAASKKLLESTSSQKEFHVSLSPDLKEEIADLNLKLIKETVDTKKSTEDLVGQRTDKQGWVQSTSEKASVLFQAGRTREAVDEWKKLSDYWADGSASRVLIEKFDATYQDKVHASQALELARLKQKEKFEAPKQLEQFLNEANTRVLQEIENSKSQQSRMQTEVQNRYMQMDNIWKKGQLLMQQGKYREAVYEWDKLTVYLDEDSAVKPAIDNLKLQLQKMDQTKASTEKYIATEYREQRIPFADDLRALLTELNSKIQYQTDEAGKQRSDMERTVFEKETWLKTTFEKGKAYYEAGKYKEAIEFWISLQPALKNNPELSSIMAGLKERFQTAVQARKDAEAAEAKRDEKFPVPDELPQLIAALNEKISTKQFEHISRAEKAEQSLQDRSAAMTSIFMKGKSLYEANDIEGALK